MQHPVGKTANGMTVIVDLIHSDAAKHIGDQPHLLGLAKEALRSSTVKGTEISVECDMGRVIGYSFIVNTTDNDANVFYAQPVRDNVYSRYVKAGEPATTQFLTLILHQGKEKDVYELQDAWIGLFRPPRPGSENETVESKTFWESHAFILGNEAIQSRTITKTCPY